MKVTIAALSRFQMFDQALELKKAGMLGDLITSYPRWALGHYRDLQRHVISRPGFAARALLLGRLTGLGSAWVAKWWRHRIHSGFARTTSKALRENSDAVIGMSSFMKEVISPAQQCGARVIVDHASLHERTERRILEAECRSYGFRPFGNWQHQWLIERMEEEFARADFVFCCSSLAKETLIQNGVDGGKIFVNRLGVDLSQFYSSQENVNDGDRFRAIYVGGVHPRKGVHYLLEAFKSLPRGSELWLVGAKPNDPVLKKILQNCMEKVAGIRLWGTVPQSRLASLYRQCDVFVLPSLADGWGMVVNQAMACGLPVVVSEATGAKEIVREGIDGYVVPSRSSEALESRLRELAADPDRVRAMGTAAAQSARSGGFTWSDYGDRLVSWLQRNLG